jgi:hypothetical protein
MATRKDEKEQRRAERIAAEQAEQEAAARRRRIYALIVGGVLAVAAVGAIVAVVASGGGDTTDAHKAMNVAQDKVANASAAPEQTITDLAEAAAAAGCVVKNPAVAGSTHEAPGSKLTFKTEPPTSGNHYAEPADDGAYDTRPNPGYTTHTLEHGRIYIQYQPSLDPQRIKQLGGLFNEDPYHMVISPNRKMPYDVAVTAWGHLAGCKKVTDETFDVIRAFRERYRDQGPEQVP